MGKSKHSARKYRDRESVEEDTRRLEVLRKSRKEKRKFQEPKIEEETHSADI